MKYESMPGLSFQCARDIPNDFEKGDALTHTYSSASRVVGEPLNQTRFHAKRCTPTVALLNEAPRALREVVKKSGRDPKDSALYSLRIGGTSTTVAGEKYQIE